MPGWTVAAPDDDGVAALTFTRPPGNFMDFASMIELGDRLDGLAAQRDRVKVIVLASGDDEVFINHAELDDLARAGRGEATEEELGSWARALHLLEHVPQPTIAAIGGLASGGGNELALACTLRIASDRASLQQPEVAVGIIPGGGGSVRLPRLVGPGVAAEAILTGRPFSAQEAQRAGWVGDVLAHEGFAGASMARAKAIAAAPAEALFAAKRSIVYGSRLPFDEAAALERELFTRLQAGSGALAA
jgi:enoyl-CoA hydratase